MIETLARRCVARWRVPASSRSSCSVELQTRSQLRDRLRSAIRSRSRSCAPAADDQGHAFKLVWVDAKLETRFDRIQRARSPRVIPRSVAEPSRTVEARERGSDDPNAQQLDRRRSARGPSGSRTTATLEAFQAADRTTGCARIWPSRRPGLGRLLHGHRAASLRPARNCVKRKVAAVVTRDRRIISTGYNGTPRGTRNCNEGGCPRCNELRPPAGPATSTTASAPTPRRTRSPKRPITGFR